MTEDKKEVLEDDIVEKRFRSALDYLPLTKDERKAQRKYLDERLTALHHRQRVIENE